MADLPKIILEELREHRRESTERHALMEMRVRSLEDTRSQQKGAAKMGIALATTLSGLISFIVSTIRG
jgi:hypothetical protein